jgi:Fe-S cluster assembly protein SufD
VTVGSTAPPRTEPFATERHDALERIGVIGYPTRRDEAWRYAPNRLLGDLEFGPPGEPAREVPDIDGLTPVLDGPRIVVVNGIVDRERSDLSTVDGLELEALAGVASEQPDRVAAHFDVPGDAITDAYLALNIAFGNDGAVVRVSDGAEIEQPIHIVSVEIPEATRAASCTGVVIEVGADASATVVETRIGAGTEFGGSNIRTTITLAADASLEHVLLQDAPESQVHLSRVDVRQAAGSTFRARSFNLGASYGRLAYDVRLTGPDARADLSGLFFGFGDQTLDQQISVVHDAPDCTSRQSYRGVLDDSSTGVFNGGIDVKPGADGTDAAQSNDNLLLSDRAEIDTQPRLEILADEVACAHGATVGQLDETALYYMRSRGIPVAEARRLLINGFADQVVDDVGIDTVRRWIAHRLGHDDV